MYAVKEPEILSHKMMQYYVMCKFVKSQKGSLELGRQQMLGLPIRISRWPNKLMFHLTNEYLRGSHL